MKACFFSFSNCIYLTIISRIRQLYTARDLTNIQITYQVYSFSLAVYLQMLLAANIHQSINHQLRQSLVYCEHKLRVHLLYILCLYHIVIHKYICQLMRPIHDICWKLFNIKNSTTEAHRMLSYDYCTGRERKKRRRSWRQEYSPINL